MTMDERKHQLLHELLGAFGNNVISRDEFWRRMNAAGLTDADIDAWCAWFHAYQGPGPDDVFEADAGTSTPTARRTGND